MRIKGTTRLGGMAFVLVLVGAGCQAADERATELEIAEAVQPVTWSDHVFGIHDTELPPVRWTG